MGQTAKESDVLSQSPTDSLKERIELWLQQYPNPYNLEIEEKVYWTIRDLYVVLSKSDDEHIKHACMNIFTRLRHIHK